MTANELATEFGVYFREMQRCEEQKCYWALLHMLLVIPDICGSLENPGESSSDRYVRWCRENMPPSATVDLGDRYQMRNAVLHEGTTLADNPRTGARSKKSKYRCFSFVDPENFTAPIHQTVNDDGTILNINIVELSRDTQQAMRTWFDQLQRDPFRLAEVERNLPKLARVKPKVAEVAALDGKGTMFTVTHRGMTTSSS